MADSITKVGSFEILDIQPNWAGDISSDYLLSRRLTGYPGTPVILEPVADETPISLNLLFQCQTKQEKYELLTFFLSKKGRVNRFWLQHPFTSFTLKTSAVSGATGIYCKRNSFDLIYQGFERVYILMKTGDLIVRKITSCVGGNDDTYLGFDTVLDRDVTLTNHFMIGRFLLGRFGNDKISFKFSSINVSRCELNFVELVKEYTLAD